MLVTYVRYIYGEGQLAGQRRGNERTSIDDRLTNRGEYSKRRKRSQYGIRTNGEETKVGGGAWDGEDAKEMKIISWRRRLYHMREGGTSRTMWRMGSEKNNGKYGHGRGSIMRLDEFRILILMGSVGAYGGLAMGNVRRKGNRGVGDCDGGARGRYCTRIDARLNSGRGKG